MKTGKNLLTATLAVAVIVGGTLGFMLTGDGWSLLDALYMTVITVTTVGYGEVLPLSPAGRVVAMVVLFLGLGVVGLVAAQVTSYVVGGELGGLFARRRLLRRVSELSGHTIICGVGARGSWIVRGMIQGPSDAEKTGLVVIERDPDVLAAGDSMEEDVVFIQGNARDYDQLRIAGIDRAARVVIVAGSDDNNLSIAREIRAKHPASPPAVIAAVERYETRSYFADRLAAQHIVLMGFREQAALWMARDLALELVTGLNGLPQKPPEIVVEASPALRDEIARALAMMVQYTGSLRPIITLCSTVETDRQQFIASFPAADACADFRWVEEPAELYLADGKIADLAIFALDSDALSLDAADRFLLRRPAMPSGRVAACILDTGDVHHLATLPDPFKRTPRVISLYTSRQSSQGFIGHAMDAEGRALHEAYRSAVATQQRDPGKWEDLSEFLRNSNRVAALHAQIKRTMWDALVANNCDKDQALCLLSATEHMRWMAFHVMAGWRKADASITDRKLRAMTRAHPNIVPFEELDRDTKLYDLRNVLGALNLPLETAVKGISS